MLFFTIITWWPSGKIKKLLQDQFPKNSPAYKLKNCSSCTKPWSKTMRWCRNWKDHSLQHRKMKNTISSGTAIYEFVESTLSIEPVGLVPLDNKKVIFLSEGGSRQTLVYQYRISLFEKSDEKYRAMKTSFIDVWERNIVNSFQNIKSELIRKKNGTAQPCSVCFTNRAAFSRGRNTAAHCKAQPGKIYQQLMYQGILYSPSHLAFHFAVFRNTRQ